MAADTGSARIAVITDAHGNLPALRAALLAIDRVGVDALYHTGDAIAIGPYPVECLDLLANRPATHLLMGNHDEWYARGLPDPRPAWMSAGEWEHQHWVHARLGAERRRAVAAWPDVLRVEVGGVALALLHYPRGADGAFRAPRRRLERGDEADALFGERAARLLFYGHHHDQSDVTGAATRYVNPGSLGCCAEAVARFAVVTARGGRCDLTLHAVAYDAAPLLAAFDERAVPERDFIRAVFMPQPRLRTVPGVPSGASAEGSGAGREHRGDGGGDGVAPNEA